MDASCSAGVSSGHTTVMMRLKSATYSSWLMRCVNDGDSGTSGLSSIQICHQTAVVNPTPPWRCATTQCIHTRFMSPTTAGCSRSLSLAIMLSSVYILRTRRRTSAGELVAAPDTATQPTGLAWRTLHRPGLGHLTPASVSPFPSVR